MVDLNPKFIVSQRNNLSTATLSYTTTLNCITELRPWGSFTVLEEGENYKVKRFSVLPGCRLSLQYHHKRSEHWTIVSGKALVTRNEEIFEVESGQTVFIPVKAVHRIENISADPVVVIEVQYGSYVGEDDIVRLADDYDRS
jgi:mannose-6-phosphate isomerase-like protein (cupin superfamily)